MIIVKLNSMDDKKAIMEKKNKLFSYKVREYMWMMI